MGAWRIPDQYGNDVVGKWGSAPLGAVSGRSILQGMKTREITDKLQDWQKSATETVQNVAESTDEYVRENTWTTIACAALLGCIVGYVLAGRRD